MKETNVKIGDRFSKLVVVKDSGKRPHKKILWECRCDCGNIIYVVSGDLNFGRSKSCGCLRNDIIIKRSTPHGYRNHYLYNTWNNMIQRCYNPNNTNYKYYGARGIAVCRRWRNSVANFVKDVGNKPKDTSIDRINNNGPYGKWNCRWTTQYEQVHNRRKTK